MARIGEILIDKGDISQEQLEISLLEQQRTGKLLGAILVQQGFVSDAQLSSALAEQTDGTFVDIKTTHFSPEAVALVPEKFAREKLVVPILASQTTLMVAMINSSDIHTIDELQQITGRYVDVVQSTETDLLIALDYCYTHNEEETDEKTLDALIASAEKSLGTQKDPSDTGGVAALVEYLLAYVVRRNATDIHIEPTDTIVRTRYRIDGALIPGPVLPKRLQSAIVTRLKIMATQSCP